MATEQRRIKVFVDASVLFAASASATGASREILRYAWRREIIPVLNGLVLEETERSLAAKRPGALDMFYLFRESLPLAVVEPTPQEVMAMWPYTDYEDAPHLVTAKKAHVDCLVSLDRRHMVNRRDDVLQKVGLRILLPEELLQELRGR